ncbi:hypothetical protein G3I67_01350 [Orrella sp. NBD-18]|uniref:DUF6268 domain-containing protein n=1 Tax=Sheuella amnicola TaxID=2707330 RepID=A0A6B2QT46_9BURK|nr:DUF6268 family outer membrane beta-barrel protein [Sheuella amnicola]NDY81866.1 hypothetical protein [Sheuella amnicola]
MSRLFKAGLIVAAVGSLHFSTAFSQMPSSGLTPSVSLFGLNQSRTSLDSGGSFGWSEAAAVVSLNQQFSSQFRAGVNFRYAYQNWTWSAPGAFEGHQPWKNINTPGVGLNFTYSPTPDWHLMFNPSIVWSGEAGVGTNDSAIYGAVFSAAKSFSPDLTLGLGAGVFREFDTTKVFPYLVVNWKINDRWKLSNPLPAGPTGGAGLELAYALTEKWTLAGGGSYRTYRFRLNDDGVLPGGIGQNSFIPVFARLSYRFDSGTLLDLYAAALVNGRLKAMNNNDSYSYSDQYQTGFGVALNLSHRF